MNKYVVCQCCGKKYRTRSFKTDMYTICPNCDWEQDPFVENEKTLSYANGMSISEARQNIIVYKNIFPFRPKFFQRKTKLYL
jgi:anaerobic ribonucleoside-triphosphate reductase